MLPGPVDTLESRMLKRNDSLWGPLLPKTVSVAQLVELQTVDLDVAGSNPVAHPNSS